MDHIILYIVLLLVSKACFSVQQTSTQDTKDVTSYRSDTGDRATIIENDKEHVTNNAPYTSEAVLKHCSLLPEKRSISEEIQKALENGMTMLRFKLKLCEEERLPENVSVKATNDMFKSFYWVQSTERFGTRLPLRKSNNGMMSFRSLEMKVEKFSKKFSNINTEEYPENGIDKLSYDDIEKIITELVMKNESDELDETDNVCNLPITDDDGADYFEIWQTPMRYVIRVSKASVILFCPLLMFFPLRPQTQ